MEQRLNLSLSNSIQACRQLTTLAHSNFVPAFALLPYAKRQAMEILYAYTRFTDDIADIPDYTPEGTTIEISLRRKKQKLNQWIGALEAVLGRVGEEEVPQIDPKNEEAFQQIAGKFPGCGGLVFLPALKMIVDKYNIPRDPLFHLVDGIETDMEPKPFPTLDDSMDYCHQVATSVGFASLAIWGTSEPLFSDIIVKSAKACGIAFQWTNIIRDMLEDYRNGRVYLPEAELQRFGFTSNQLGSILDGRAWAAMKKKPKKMETQDPYDHKGMVKEMEDFEEKFFKLMGHQLHRCEVYYENSLPLYHFIHRDSRRTFGLMWNYYYSLYRKIARNPWLVTRERRVQLSATKKFRLWFRWRFLLCRKLR